MKAKKKIRKLKKRLDSEFQNVYAEIDKIMSHIWGPPSTSMELTNNTTENKDTTVKKAVPWISSADLKPIKVPKPPRPDIAERVDDFLARNTRRQTNESEKENS